MPKPFRSISRSQNRTHDGKHRFEHWLVDNQVYFITARCRDKVRAFESEYAKQIFWNRFEHYFHEFAFTPWVVSLLDNHYHELGYFKQASNLPKMMQRIHGSVAKLVNDTLEIRLLPFWRNSKGKEYFDGCIRDEKQARRAYLYTLHQSVRHGITTDYRTYKHTRVYAELERAISGPHARGAFLEGVPYKRYRGQGRPGC
jgi:hypothetical protein